MRHSLTTLRHLSAALLLSGIAGVIPLSSSGLDLIQEPISIVAFSGSVEFGMIANENGICRMNDMGSLLGLNGQSCLGSGTRGEFEIHAQPGAVVFIDILGSAANGVSFAPRLTGSATKIISLSGTTQTIVVGDLTLNNANTGNYSLNFVVSVYYE